VHVKFCVDDLRILQSGRKLCGIYNPDAEIKTFEYG